MLSVHVEKLQASNKATRAITLKEDGEIIASCHFDYNLAMQVVKHVQKDWDLGYLQAYNEVFALGLETKVKSFGTLLEAVKNA
jgi:hypothetical protein